MVREDTCVPEAVLFLGKAELYLNLACICVLVFCEENACRLRAVCRLDKAFVPEMILCSGKMLLFSRLYCHSEGIVLVRL